MTIDQVDLLKIAARLTVLEHAFGALFRDMAFEQGKSSKDVARYAETQKEFFENNMPPGLTEMHINAAVDRLFQRIAADIKDQETKGP